MTTSHRDLIALRIKTARKARGVTISEIARQAGFGESRWLNWESGLRAPKLDIIPDIANILGTSASYIAGFTDHQGDNSDSWDYIVPATSANDEYVDKSFSIKTDELRNHGLRERGFTILHIKNDAMAPDLKAGDSAMFNTEVNNFTTSGIYAINSQDQLWILRIRKEIDGNFTLFTNDQNYFPEREFTAEEMSKLEIIGRYVGHWHWSKA